MLNSLRWSAWGPVYWALVGVVASFIAMVALLAHFDNKPVFTWQGVTLNTITSILSVTIKAAIAFVISECMAQWKWILFIREERPLIDFDRIDGATRGPLGSLRILLKSKGATTVQFGAILTIIAIGLDPLAQQIIQLRENMVFTDSSQLGDSLIALNSRATDYSGGSLIFAGNGTNVTWLHTSIPISMQGAIMSGLSKSPWQVEQEVPIQCPTTNCTWNPFKTIGVCHKCNEITSKLKRVDGKVDNTPTTAFILPNGHYIDNDYKSPRIVTASMFSTAIPSKTNTMREIDTLLWSMSIIYLTHETDKQDNSKARWLWPPPDDALKATECALYYCVKNINSSVISNQVIEVITEVTARRSPDSWVETQAYNETSEEARGTYEFEKYSSSIEYSDLRFEFPDNATESNFTVSKVSITSLGAYFQELFRSEMFSDTTIRRKYEDLFGRGVIAYNGQMTGVFMGEYITNITTFIPPALEYFWTPARENYFDTFYALATSMTNEMRWNVLSRANEQNGQNRDRFKDGTLGYPGKAWNSVVQYHIRWPWITLHGLMILSTILFWLNTLKSCGNQDDVPLWKSSSLAAIRHGHDVGRVLSGATTIDAMENTARMARVTMRGRDCEEIKSCISRSSSPNGAELRQEDVRL
ncbi:hypothetical protein EsH8_XII_000017 [Colletotrichum jinshuiense]